MKAVAAMASGSMTALVPIVVPTTILVNGAIVTIRIKIGKERIVLMIKLRTA